MVPVALTQHGPKTIRSKKRPATHSDAHPVDPWPPIQESTRRRLLLALAEGLSYSIHTRFTFLASIVTPI
jgi:hypothetical protein